MTRTGWARVTRAALVAVVTLLLTSGAIDSRNASAAREPVSRAAQLDIEGPIATRIGEQRQITLPGGQAVVLNTATRIHTKVLDGVQEITLEEGELLVDSMQSSPAPSQIQVSAGDIALETTNSVFTVSRDKAEAFTVRVFDGFLTLSQSPHAVHPRPGLTRVRLEAGRSAMIGPGALVFSRFSDEHRARFLAWRRGLIVFEGESLERAIVEFNRYNEQKIRIADARIGKLRVGGIYSATKPAQFTHALETIFDVRAESIPAEDGKGSVIVLKPDVPQALVNFD